MERVAGKRAFVTAAGQGIGRAAAEALAREGAHVIATDLNATLLEGIATTEHFALDVLDKTALTRAVRDAAPDILVNCAGVVHAGTIQDVTDEEYGFAMSLNVKSQIDAIQAVLPGMLERGGGSIVNIASVASSVMGVPNRFAYSTSKAAVVGLTKSVARDYVARNITCNCVAPGTVDTPSLHERLHATGNYEQAMKDFVARQPMGRLGTPAEIADLVVYLSSAESRYMTGQCLVIDGGMSL